MTAPYAADTPDLLRASHGQVVRATLEHARGSIPLDLTSADLVWDETSVPRATATLQVPGLNDFRAVDPRTGPRVSIEVGYVRPGGVEDVHRVMDLGVREARWNEETATMRLHCAGDEALVVDASPVVGESVSLPSHTSAMKDLVRRCINPYPRFNDPAGNLGPAVTVDVVNDRWTAIADLADQIDAVIYDAGLRTWVIEPRPVLADTPTHTLVVGEQGTILRADLATSREDWFNHVTLTYRWREDDDDLDQQVQATAMVIAGDHSMLGPAGKRSMVEERDVSSTYLQAQAVARTLLTRAISRSATFQMQAVAAYWVRPGMTIGVQLPHETKPSLHLVTRVQFDPIAGTMDVDTRTPLPVFPYTGTVAQPPDPDPLPPARQRYVSTWTANGSEAYLGSGNRWTSTDEPVQGYTPTTGNNQGLMIFTAANSAGDASNRTITQEMAGLTVDDIEKVELYLYANHWWNSTGGTARVGFDTGTTIPNTYSAAKPHVAVKDWKPRSGRWVNITSPEVKALLIGGGRRATVGPGQNSSPIYYARFNAAAAATNKPQLRITYSKKVV